MTSDMPVYPAQAGVQRAFAKWDNLRWVVGQDRLPFGLQWRRVNITDSPDVLVEWRSAADPDYNMVGSVIAHSDYPIGCDYVTTRFPKPIHFDDSENTWGEGALPGKFDVQTIAMHEIGHIMGLDHTTVAGSIMLPSFSTNFVQHDLSQDDLDGYQVIYRATNNLYMIWPSHVGGAGSSFRVLDVQAFSQANGAPLQLWEWVPGAVPQYSWRGATNQRLRPEYAGKAAYRFVAEHSGKVLDVLGASTANGAPIIQWDWHGGDNQLFRVENALGSSGNSPSGPRVKLYRITAVHSGKVLDVENWSQALGAKIQQWDWLGGDNQLWGFGP